MARPKVNSQGERELAKTQEQFEKFDEEVKSLTLDRMNQAPKEEKEDQTKLTAAQCSKMNEIYLKPVKTINPGCAPKSGKMTDVFNEKWRNEYEYDRKYVRFIAENHEIIGETIKIWTRPYSGIPAEYWEVPVNKPVWGPRYLAEQIKRKNYHRLVMNDHKQVGQDGMATYVGGIVVDSVVQRIDAKPCPQAQVSFNRASNF